LGISAETKRMMRRRKLKTEGGQICRACCPNSIAEIEVKAKVV
jgi:hypothetical protein